MPARPELHPSLLNLQASFAACPVTRIADPLLTESGVELWIKRDDLLHPVISGNKWRKLKYILNHALLSKAECVISMGGAYSNHLHALAFAGLKLNLKTAAFIRGERPVHFNPTLTDLLDWGMDLRFVSRSEYRLLRESKFAWSGLQSGEYWLPEGGATNLALQGVMESVTEIPFAYDVLAAACGSGATLAGLIAAARPQCQVLGIAALRAPSLVDEVAALLRTRNITANNWQICFDYHFGGFAKTTPELSDFIQAFEIRHGIPLEPIYTGKLLFGIYSLLKAGHFKPGQRLVVLHSGGLQGKREQGVTPAENRSEINIRD